MKLTILFDNFPYKEGLKTSWGFSCLVNSNFLFDTGGDGEVLLHNINKLKIDPKKIKRIFISHDHWDHTGGLSELLKRTQTPKVYILKSFSQHLRRRIEMGKAERIEIERAGKLYENIYSTGGLGTWIKEQSLVIKHPKGLLVLTGCAHPGIVNILNKVKEMFKEEIYLVIGGFHLGGYPRKEILRIISHFRDLGVKKAGPSHCTGDRPREFFKQEYGDDFLEVGVGRVIEI